MRYLIKTLLVSLSITSFLSCSEGEKSASDLEWKSYSGDPVIERKVDSVLQLMTLDEKIGQMNQYSGNFATTGQVTQTQSGEYLEKGMIGSTFNVYGADHIRMLQEQNLKHSRLGIPMLFAADVIHGLETIFPIPLAESCSWDLDLMERTSRIAAEEATASGIAWNFAPMIDLSRDPRWGRVMEGAGEDVFLLTQVARARVRGFQNINNYTDFAKNNTMMACSKHFVAYGAAQGGRDYHTVDISERTLYETHFPPFKATVEEGVTSVMTAFNEVNGVPATGNKYLFREILRDQWSFGGMVLTDYTAIQEMVPHGFAKDLKHASKLALEAGVDMDMISEGFVTHLKELVQQGEVDEKQIDIAVSRILEMKFLLGLFDDPFRYCNAQREKEVVFSEEHLKVARESAQRSIVLLKNENNILPLKKDAAMRVGLIGPFFHERESLNGEWAIKGDREKSVTLMEGIQEKYEGTPVSFAYAKGTDLPEIDRNTQKVSSTNVPDKSGFAEAIRVAQNSDIILVAMGEKYHWSGEAASRTDITLPGNQRELLKELKKTGKPIVLVLFNGRPLDLSWEDENLDAIVEAWYPGTMSGHAVADVIAGDYNPSAKLVMSFPRNVGQIPVFYNQKNTGRPFDENNPTDYKSFYIDTPNSPLYPFGYGLSYTSFEYSDANISSADLQRGDSISVSVKVTNTGNMDGEEIVQLYIQDKVGSITRPVKELKGFQKIHLRKGESKTVEFFINEETLKMYDIDMEWVAEPGEFGVWLATSSDDESQYLEFSLVE